MIPDFNMSGVLPPFDPTQAPTRVNAVAPYKTSMLEVVQRFATTEQRRQLLHGLIDYRAALRSMGFINGTQWLNGSFTENVEQISGREPNDIDIVTFARRPVAVAGELNWKNFFNTNIDLFHPGKIKETYSCDAYFEDLALAPEVIVRRTSYWFGLFSHQRETFLWKGLLEVQLNEDDAQALDFLKQGGSDGPQVTA